MSLNPETLPSEISVEQLYADTFTANGNSASVDVKEYIGKLAVVLNAAAAADNNQPVAVSITHSDEASANFTDFDPAIAFPAIAANGVATVHKVEVDTNLAKRYIRAALTESAAGNGRALTISVIGKKQVTA